MVAWKKIVEKLYISQEIKAVFFFEVFAIDFSFKNLDESSKILSNKNRWRNNR